MSLPTHKLHRALHTGVLTNGLATHFLFGSDLGPWVLHLGIYAGSPFHAKLASLSLSHVSLSHSFLSLILSLSLCVSVFQALSLSRHLFRCLCFSVCLCLSLSFYFSFISLNFTFYLTSLKTSWTN